MASNPDILQPAHLVGYDILALDVAFISNEHLGGFADFFLLVYWSLKHFFQFGDNFGETCHRQLWAGDELGNFTAEMEWGGAEGFQRGIDIFRMDRRVVAEIENLLYLRFFLYPSVVPVLLCEAEVV